MHFTILVFILIGLSSCISPLEKGSVDVSLDVKSKVNVTAISLSNDKLTLSGSGLNTVNSIKLESTELSIISKSFNSIVLSASSNINLLLNTSLNLIINTAQGATTIPVVFNLVDGSVTASKLSDMGASVGQVLKWNGTTWEATDLSGLTYAGNWNAASNSPDLSTGGSLGQYFIVETAGTFDLSGGVGTNSWLVGDWAVWNDVASRWEKVSNGSTVTKFNGRSGIVNPQAGDYTWAQINKTSSSINDITDVNTTGATLNQVLKWNGSAWVASNDEVATAGSVTSSAIADGSIMDADINGSANISQSKILNLTSTLAGKAPMPPTCTAGNKLLFDGTNFSCVVDAVSSGDITDVVAGTGLIGGASSGSATLSVDVGVSANKIVQLNSSGKLPAVDGSLLTNLPAQSDATKLPLAGGTMSGILNMGSQKIIGLATPTISSDAATKAYVDSSVSGLGSGDITDVVAGTGLTGGAASGSATLNVDVGVTANKIVQLDSSAKLPAVDGSQLINLPVQTDASRLALIGGTMSGDIDMGTNQIGNLGSPVLATDAATKGYVDTAVTGFGSGDFKKDGSVSMTGNLDFGNNKARLKSDNANYVELKAPDSLAQTYLLTLPADDGTSGQVLTTNGTGTLSWTTPTPGGAGDITDVVAGTGLTGGAATGSATLNVDVGTTANKIVQLDSSAKLPAIDGSQLTNLPVQTDSSKLPLTGGTLSGVLNMGAQYISNLQTPLLATDAANKSYVDSVFAGITSADIPSLDTAKITTGVFDTARIPTGTDTTKLPLTGGTMSGALNMGTNLVSNIATPVSANDAATKAYVDAAAPDLSDIKNKAAGTYNRENMSLEALREQLDILKTEVDTVKTNQGNLAADVGNVQSSVNSIGASAGAYTWQVASADATIAVGNAYAVSGADLVNFTLPSTCSAGESLQLVSGGDKGYKIFANSGQSILYNGQIGGMVVTGFATVTIICVADNTTWLVKNIDGTATISKIGTGSTSPLSITWFGASSNDFLDGNISGVKGSYDSYSSNNRTCAMINSEFYCMGQGTSVTNYYASKIDGITDPKQVTYGLQHICVLENSGGVKCFGANSYGQLGDGTNTASNYIAVQVSGLTSGVNKLIAGYSHTCADHNNEIKCWGYNGSYELGDGTTTSRNSPTTVAYMSNTGSPSYIGYGGLGVAIDKLFTNGQYATCAIKATRVYCWGTTILGSSSASYPLNLFNISNLIDVYCDGGGCAFHTNVSTYTALTYYDWGGNHSQTQQSLPGTLNNEKIKSIAGSLLGLDTTGNAGYTNATIGVVTATGKLYLMGRGYYGQALNSTTDRSSFYNVPGSYKKIATLVDNNSFCTIDSINDLYCWGYNSDYRLGNGSNVNASTKTFILSGVTDFTSTSQNLSYALKDNKLYAWGYYHPTNTYLPVGYFPDNQVSNYITRPMLAKIDDENTAIGSFSSLGFRKINSSAICFDLNNKLRCYSHSPSYMPGGTDVHTPFIGDAQYNDP